MTRSTRPAGGVGPDEPPPRGSFRLLLDPRFGPYFLGRVISSAGIWIHNIVAALLAFELTGSAFVVGLVSVAQFTPQLVLAPLSGAMADRGNRRRQAIVGRYVVAAGTGSIAAWLTFVDASERADVTVLLISALVVGLGFVTGGPALHAMVPGLVRSNEVATAVTLGMVPVTLARAAGPALGAAIALALDPAAAFALAGACNVAFALLLLRVKVVPPATERGADRSFWGGFAFLRTDRGAGYLLIGVAAVGLGADPAITLAPSISAGFGAGSAYTGAFASAFGVGAGAAFVVIPWLRRRIGLARSATGGLLAMAAGLAALTFAAVPWSAAAAFGLSGLGMTLAVTNLSSQLQQRVPDQVRGRVMALWSMGYLGSRPLAAATNGAVADLVSVDAALALGTVMLVTAAVVCSPRRVGTS